MSRDTKRTFNEKAAAEILDISERTLYRWRKRGLIGHFVTPTGRISYSLDHLLAAKRCEQPAGYGEVSEDGGDCPKTSDNAHSTADDGVAMVRT